MHMTARSIVAQSAARSRDAIEQVSCSRCGAKPGVRCKTSGGWKSHNPHLERRAAAQNAGTWQPPDA